MSNHKKRCHEDDNGSVSKIKIANQNSNNGNLISSIFGQEESTDNYTAATTSNDLFTSHPISFPKSSLDSFQPQEQEESSVEETASDDEQKQETIQEQVLDSIAVNLLDYYVPPPTHAEHPPKNHVDENELRLLVGKCSDVMRSSGVLVLTCNNATDNNNPSLLLDPNLLERMSKRATEIEKDICLQLNKVGQKANKETKSTPKSVICSSITRQQFNNDKDESSFRYREVASRCLGRLDIRHQMNQDPFLQLTTNPFLTAILKSLLGHDMKLVYVGLIASQPGSVHQPWHQDGAQLFEDLTTDLPPYAMNVFVPLVDITKDLGPTEFIPSSHLLSKTHEIQNILTRQDVYNSTTISPLLQKGEVLFYDYRTCHRGTCNTALVTRPMVYMIYAKPWFQEHLNFGQESLFS